MSPKKISKKRSIGLKNIQSLMPKNLDLNKYVIGYNSMAMYLASKVNKRIFHADNNLKRNILPIKINKFDKIFKYWKKLTLL